MADLLLPPLNGDTTHGCGPLMFWWPKSMDEDGTRTAILYRHCLKKDKRRVRAALK